MENLWLIGIVSASYLATIFLYRRGSTLWGRARGLPPGRLRRLHLGAALAPLVREHPGLSVVADALVTGALAEAHASFLPLAATLGEAQRSWTEAALALAEAERTAKPLRRYLLAAKARRLARRARSLTTEPAACYLWLQATLGFLTDSINLEVVLWQTGWVLHRALKAQGQEPLLHLSAALRASVAGETAECLQALARALYHARGDRFIAALIVDLPQIDDLAPALAAQAVELLETPVKG